MSSRHRKSQAVDPSGSLSGRIEIRSREHPKHGMSFEISMSPDVGIESDNLCVTPNYRTQPGTVVRERILEFRPFGIASARSIGDINLRV